MTDSETGMPWSRAEFDALMEQARVQIEQAAEVIRRLCQGRGLLQAPHEVDIDSHSLGVNFKVHTVEELVKVIKRVYDLLPVEPSVNAIYNALGGAEQGETLTERRNAFLASSGTGRRSVSYRTLVRYEQEGALKMASIINKVQDSRYRPGETLEERIEDLETIVMSQVFMIEQLLHMISRRRGKLDAGELQLALYQDDAGDGGKYFNYAARRLQQRYSHLRFSTELGPAQDQTSTPYVEENPSP